MPRSAEEHGVAERDGAAVDRAGHALAGRRAEIAAPGPSAMPRSAAAATIAAASGCSLARSTLAARRSTSSSVKPRPAPRRDDPRLAFGQVPVLSTTRVSTLSSRSSASAFLTRTPACAPRPTPTMIDIGVARPSAQGQAMISTRDRGDQARRRSAARARSQHQAANAASAATMTTAGTNQRRDLVGEALDRRPRALRLARPSATICASRVSRPTCLGAHDEARRCC